MNRLTNKIALITGGNSGIGLATAKAFVQEGAKIAITGRDSKTLERARQELGKDTLALVSDTSQLKEIDRLIGEIRTKFGRLDVLFLNAGVGKFMPVDQMSEQAFDEMFSVNVKGLYFTIQKALPLLSDGASIILNASIAAHMAFPTTSVYAASKAAVLTLGRVLAAELSARKIRVNMVSPGPIETPIFGRLGQSAAEIAQFKETMQSQTLLKRFGTAQEIAQAVVYFASADSSFTTGSEIIVDGGMQLL